MASIARLVRHAASTVTGKIDALRHGTSQPKQGMDDVTLTRKVETELFRAADSPKASVNVSAVDGVIELRGQVKRPEDVNDLEAKVRAIPEVRDVRNLLHLPKTPSPTRADSPRPHQKRAETHPAGHSRETP
jgi:osmotically-inducible protein OsmY